MNQNDNKSRTVVNYNRHNPFLPTPKPMKITISRISFEPVRKRTFEAYMTISNVKISSIRINSVRIKSTHSHTIIVNSTDMNGIGISIIRTSTRTRTRTINCISIKQISISRINIRRVTKTSILSRLNQNLTSKADGTRHLLRDRRTNMVIRIY